MRMYRSIGFREYYSLLTAGWVEGRFQTENEDSTYSASLGPVVCAFEEPVYLPGRYPLMVELEIPEELILGCGVAEFHSHSSCDCASCRDLYDFTARIPEVYLPYYTVEHVVSVYGDHLSLEVSPLSDAAPTTGRWFRSPSLEEWEEVLAGREIWGDRLSVSACPDTESGLVLAFDPAPRRDPIVMHDGESHSLLWYSLGCISRVYARHPVSVRDSREVRKVPVSAWR